jgi:GTP-binding protein
VNLPLVAVVGRPNVGKSTLFNRITGTRRSIVTSEPGMTRDRIYGQAEWNGKLFELADTGGILPGDQEVIPRQILRHAQVAVRQAAQIILVVDGREEITGADRELAWLLRRTGKPLVLAVNKADSPGMEAGLQEWHSLGMGRVFFISAEHKLGVDEMLEEVTRDFPAAGPGPEQAAPEETRVAIIGKPNVGKSTLLNLIAGEERSMVTPIPGTTRDAVDLLVESPAAGRLRLVDTAGIRRKGKTKLAAEKLSVVMAERHVRLCDLALLMVDALEGASALDATIAGYAHQHGKGLILVVNKWDLVENKRLRAGQLMNTLRREMPFLDYAPMQFLSAQSGFGIAKLMANVRRVAQARLRRVPTAELNRFFEALDLERARLPLKKRIKIYYLTQAGVRPPTFVLFTDRAMKLEPSLERYLETQIRRRFDFEGTPIVFKVRGRGKSPQRRREHRDSQAGPTL